MISETKIRLRGSAQLRSKSISKSIICIAILSGNTACGPSHNSNTGLEFTVANRSAKNIALLIGAPNDLPGVRRDIINVGQMLRQSNLGYEVQEINRASRTQILNAAANVGRSISAESTVFFYFSGHGAQSGTLISQGNGSVTLKEVASAIGKNVSGGRFTRFIGVIDACFSGQSVDGNQAIFLNESDQTNVNAVSFTNSLASGSGKGLFDFNFTNSATNGNVAKGNAPFNQGLVLAAARKSEMSLDGGSAIGGVFTASWLSAIKTNSSATIGEILERARQKTIRNSGGSHTPVWKAMPSSFLAERFNGGGGQSPNTPQNPPDTPSNPSPNNPGNNVNPDPAPVQNDYEQLLNQFLEILTQT